MSAVKVMSYPETKDEALPLLDEIEQVHAVPATAAKRAVRFLNPESFAPPPSVGDPPSSIVSCHFSGPPREPTSGRTRAPDDQGK